MVNENTSLLDGISFSEQSTEKETSPKRAAWTAVAWALLGVAVGVMISRTTYVDKKPASSTSNNQRYTHVQGLGFEIYTGGAPAFLNDNTTTNPECIGRNSYGLVVDGGMQCYVGHDDAIQDVHKRMEIMETAVERAFELSDKSDATLKVFIAPEFFWRGVDGAYVFQDEISSTDECGAICHILTSLEQLVAQERFKDWLFLFGTVIASDILPKQDEYDFLFYNFAPVLRGYDPQKTSYQGKRFLLPKRYVSSSDFLTPRRFLNDTVAKELLDDKYDAQQQQDETTVFNPFDFKRKRYDHDMWQKYKHELTSLGYAMIDYDWLMVDGIAFTIEICFDHDRRTALNTYLADMMTGSNTVIPSVNMEADDLQYVPIPKHQAQVSIVSSAGMTVTVDALVLTNGGTIFLQDGLTNEPSRMFWSTDECQKGLEFEGGTEAVQRRAVLTSTDVFFEHNLVDAYKKHHVYSNKDWHAYLNGTFSAMAYPPKLTVYDPIDIVKVAS